MNRIQTKADYEEGGVFGIYAYHLPIPADSDRITAWNPTDATAYLENVAFRYDGTTATGWDPSANSGSGAAVPYYWPLSGSIAFTGYSPYHTMTDAITGVDYYPNLSANPNNPYLTIDFVQKTAPAQQVELLYFTTMSRTVDKNTGSGSVPLTFSRAMSKVSISFKDDNSYYRIANVKVGGCVNKGTFYAAALNPNWNPDITAVSEYTILAGPVQLAPEPASCAVIYPISQPLNGEYPTLHGKTEKGVYLTFELIDKTDDNFRYVLEYKLYNAALPEKWEMGMHYQYVFTVTADPIQFDSPSITVDAFEEKNLGTI